MDKSGKIQAPLILGLLLSGVLCAASITPYMAVYIVQTLGEEPKMISLYAAITLSTTILVNRQYGEWIDKGIPIAPLILASIVAFVVGVSSILLFPSYWLLVFLGGPCFAISNSAVSTMYSFGRLYAERNALNIERYNSYLRAMTSLGWMIAPAIAFLIADRFGTWAVFKAALSLSIIWLILWKIAIPADFRSNKSEENSSSSIRKQNPNPQLRMAALVCLMFAMAHSMSTTALPLFYIQEAGLPTFAPGVSLSVKTFVEIFAILLAPWLIFNFGTNNSLKLSGILALIAFAILSQVVSLPIMITGAAFEGLYYGMFAAIGLTYVQEFARGRMARATSLYMNSLYAGGLIANPLMGLIAQYLSFRTSIQLSSIWIVIALLLLFYIGKAQSRNPAEPPKTPE